MSKNNTFFFYFFAVVASLFLATSISSCRKEKFFEDSSAILKFSKDTVIFDTVFTTVGSTYERFTVTNPYNNTINLSEIRLGNGTASAFRMNVDGVSGVLINDIEIPGNDSIFVFIEVTVDPNNINNPFVIDDYISFMVNGNEQKVHLAAWGQNAYFHFNELICGETWAIDKPHVLYGITAVGFPGLDSNCTLIIPAGAIIYGHSNSVLYVYKSKLIVNGTESSRVLFQGDRREPAFANEPGQWFGIRFAIAQNSEINYAIIKNATAGIYVDTAFGIDSLKLYGVESFNHSFASLFAQGARVNAVNCKFNRAGNNAVSLRLGGDYFFNHCTINNYWTSSSRTTPALVLNDYFEANSTLFSRPINVNFNNSIIYGDIDNEIVIDTLPGNSSSYRFNHCLIKTNNPLTLNFVSVINNSNPNYASNSTLKLSSSSTAAIDRGDPNPIYYIPTDIENNTRSTPRADLGCHEY
jgi:hypothetical protein